MSENRIFEICAHLLQAIEIIRKETPGLLIADCDSQDGPGMLLQSKAFYKLMDGREYEYQLTEGGGLRAVGEYEGTKVRTVLDYTNVQDLIKAVTE